MQVMTLPEHWTARDALLVYEFLAEIQACIWCKYGVALTEAYQRECGGDDDATLQVDWIDWHGEADF